MRLRNIKNKDDLNNSEYIIADPFLYKGKYNKIFNNSNPLQVEIGMGKGKFIIDMAKKYPHINFIGIEKFSSVMVRALFKLREQNIPNLRLIVIDALEIDNIFDKEIDKIYLNFSDPWPKIRHSKRRLTSKEFLDKYDKIFKKHKKITMKTDNRGLFEYSLCSLSQKGYILEEVTFDLQKEKDEANITTEYEEKFMILGKPIYRIKAVKED